MKNYLDIADHKIWTQDNKLTNSWLLLVHVDIVARSGYSLSLGHRLVKAISYVPCKATAAFSKLNGKYTAAQ